MFKYLNKGISTPIAIGIILILSAILGSFTILQYSEIQKGFNIIEIKIPEKKDETADWKIYKNNEYGYELKYPLDWEFIPKSEEKIVIIKESGCYFNLSLSNDINEVIKSCKSLHGPFSCNKEEKIINDTSFISIAWASESDEYFFQKDDKQFSIRLFYPKTEDFLFEKYLDCKNELNQIISTFKFLDEWKRVNISINKNEYDLGDEFSVKIKNRLEKSVWFQDCPAITSWGLQVLKEGGWKELNFSFPLLKKEGEACYFAVCEKSPKELKPGEATGLLWWPGSICLWPLEIVDVPEIKPQLIPDGTYRIFFNFGFTEDFNLSDSEVVYSDEFVIKQKIENCSNTDDCPKGELCYKFGSEESICWFGNPCYKCNSGKCTVCGFFMSGRFQSYSCRNCDSERCYPWRENEISDPIKVTCD